MLAFPRFKPLPELESDTPLVSVVLFCRNRARFVGRAVESLLAQTYLHWELVVQDGASTDGTREILATYADPRIKVISEPDEGPFEAMWRAFRRCRGEVIGSCLSDETLEPGTLENGVRYLRCNPSAGAVFGDLMFTDAQGIPLARQNCTEFNPLDYLGFEGTLTLQATLFRREALEAVGWSSRTWRTDCADFEIMARLGDQFRLDYHPGVVGQYCQFHEGQLSTTPAVGFFCAVGQLRFIDEFIGKDPGRNLLRDIPLRQAHDCFQKLYRQSGAHDLSEKMAEIYRDLAVRAEPDSLALVDQAAAMGKPMLAFDRLSKLTVTVENSTEISWRTAELLEELFLPGEAAESWHWLAGQGAPGARERLLRARLCTPGVTSLQLLADQKKWAQSLQAVPGMAGRKVRDSPPRRMRLALHAPRWSDARIVWQVLAWLPHLDANRCELICYGSEPSEAHLLPENAQFRCLPAESSSAEIRARLLDDDLDLLIELGDPLSTRHWSALAARCAPIQVAYLGVAATSGIRSIDYLLVDTHQIPSTFERFYTEKIWHVPGCHRTWTRPSESIPTRAPAGKLDDRFTLLSCGAGLLMNRAMIELWGNIMKELPGAWLLLCNEEFSSTDTRIATRAAFSMNNVPMDSLRIIPRAPGALAPSLLAQADLYLDTYPQSDAFGCLQALDFGIPVVTREGETLASRQAGALLRAENLSSYAVSSFEEYQARAVQLATDPSAYRSYRHRLDSGQASRPHPAEFAKTFLESAQALMENHRPQGTRTCT